MKQRMGGKEKKMKKPEYEVVALGEELTLSEVYTKSGNDYCNYQCMTVDIQCDWVCEIHCLSEKCDFY